MHDLPSNASLYADSNRGIYIPQYFAESVDWNQCDNWNDDQKAILLSGPDHESYWDVWNEILDNVTLSGGFVLYQDGDLWLVPSDWNPEQFADAIETLNELIESAVDYETTHKDAGDSFAHMPAESWTSTDDARLAEYMTEKGISWDGLEIDLISRELMDSFTMESGHIFSNIGDDFVIAAYPVGEIETQVNAQDIGLDKVTPEICEQLSRESDAFCRYQDDLTFLAYQTTDAVWSAIVTEKQLRDIIKDMPRDYQYFINLDERGQFYADVRLQEKTVFEIHGFDIFDDGFMRDKNDISGLADYLIDFGIMRDSDNLKKGN